MRRYWVCSTVPEHAEIFGCLAFRTWAAGVRLVSQSTNPYRRVPWVSVCVAVCRRLLEDKEGYILYTIVVLKKFLESFRNDARTKKFSVRDFTYVPENAGSGLSKIEKLELDMQETLVRRV